MDEVQVGIAGVVATILVLIFTIFWEAYRRQKEERRAELLAEKLTIQEIGEIIVRCDTAIKLLKKENLRIINKKSNRIPVETQIIFHETQMPSDRILRFSPEKGRDERLIRKYLLARVLMSEINMISQIKVFYYALQNNQNPLVLVDCNVKIIKYCINIIKSLDEVCIILGAKSFSSGLNINHPDDGFYIFPERSEVDAHLLSDLLGSEFTQAKIY